jgi:dTDP-4-dehydrorhamnose 3,5-epimerase
MPMKQDVQTVAPDGRRLAPLPEGMVVRDLVTHVDDRYAFLAGELELVFYDAREPEQSATAGLESRIVLSGHHRRLLTIPAGVWHAERNLGATDVVVVNFPTIQYDHTAPDKYRLPLDTDELPVELGAGWRGW